MFRKSRMVIECVPPKKQYDYIQWLSEWAEKISGILKIPFNEGLVIVNEKTKRRVSMASLMERCKLIKSLDIPQESSEDLIKCLTLHTYNIEHNYWLLRDLGVNVNRITVRDIRKLHSMLKLPGAYFKEFYDLHPNASLVENIFSNIGEYPHNMPSLEKYQDTMLLGQTYSHYLLCYQLWKTGLKMPKLSVYYSRPKFTTNMLSFTLIKDVSSILRTEFNVTGKIPRRMYPFFISTPNSIRILLSRLPELDLDNKNVKDILIGNPRLLLACPHNVYSVCKTLQEHRIPLINALNVSRYGEIFIFGKELIEERLQVFAKDPFLRLWCHHKFVVGMLLHYQTVWRNLYILRASNFILNATVVTLCLPYTGLHRFLKGDYVAVTGQHISYIIKGELEMDDAEVYKYLQRHSRHTLLTPAHAAEMIQFLKTYFPVEAIAKNIHLIMHSQTDVLNILQHLEQNFDMRRYTYSQQLALCLYIAEKRKCPVIFTENLKYKKKRNPPYQSNATVTHQIENILNRLLPAAAEGHS